jgi:hypothetical protein
LHDVDNSEATSLFGKSWLTRDRDRRRPPGDGTVRLKRGDVLYLSRRTRDEEPRRKNPGEMLQGWPVAARKPRLVVTDAALRVVQPASRTIWR